MTKYSLYIFIINLIFISTVVASEVSAQYKSVHDVQVSINSKKSSVLNVIQEIESKTNFRFSYHKEDALALKNLNLSISDASVAEILTEISKEAGLMFRQHNNNISISLKSKRKKSDFLVIIQDIDITGKVTDETDQGLPGASLVIKGTSMGTTTDIDGNYKLTVPDNAIISVSYVGYVTQDIEIAGRSTIDVSMISNAERLDEVIVVGYGTEKKSDLTGAVASYKPNDNDGRQFTSAAVMLQGRMPGVAVTNNSFQPGAAASIRIRGGNSLRGDNEPLYVIDNVPLTSATLDAAEAIVGGGAYATVQSALASINPSDIERVEVLKDASATAIYGSRGANGVILITTKRGKTGSVKVSFESSFTSANISKKFDMLDLDGYMTFRNGQVTPGNEQYAKTDTVAGFSSSGNIYIPDRNEFDPSDLQSYKNISEVDWQDRLFQPALQKNYRLNLSGGTDMLNYFFAAGYQSVSGLTEGTGLEQYDFRFNMNGKLSKKLKVGFSVNGVQRHNDQQQNGDRFGASTTSSAVRSALAGRPYYYQGIDQDTEDLEDQDITTVFAWIEDYDDLATEYAFRSGLNLTYDIWNGISYQVRIGGNYRWKERSRWLGKRTAAGRSQNGLLGVSTLTAYTYTVENLLRYNKKISDNFSLDALAGYTIDNQTILNQTKYANDFDVDVLRTKGFHLATTSYFNNPIQGDFSILSYLGRVNARLFKGKYLLTASVRADGSSKFPQDRWGVFPSGALAWKVNEESFLSNADFLDQLKFRVGWGITGNQGVAPFSTVANFTSTAYYYSDDNNNPLVALQVNNLANSSLTWETTENTNLGLDFAMFDARISGSIDVYKKTTKDLLNNKSIGTSTGFSSILVNRGSLENKGIELSLSAVVFENDNWSISLGGNIAFNKGKILDLNLEEGVFGSDTLRAFIGNQITGGSVLPYPANIFIEGRQPALFWGFETDGILQETDEDVTYNTSVGTNGPGEIRYVDRNGDGVVDFSDQTIIGNPNPDYTYGFQTDVKYKGLSLRAFFNGVHGNDIINVGSYFMNYPGAEGASRNVLASGYENAWTEENPSTTHVKVGANAPEVLNDLFVENASYLRLAEVTLAYDLPSVWINKIRMSNLSFYVSGRNLLTVTNYSGYDPAANSFAFDGLRQGIDLNAFPNVRSWTVGVKATF
ncbi:TonB-dependent receptor [Reichenbachiella sp. MALMAid0571]|uniref:SusC/RagA family TonB-linked outer membrane protein n=1 Tax=Reichenbachiella sp. MALMAid0571 TaxID=3143939 RepID=UPI0032DFC4E5